MIDGRHQPVRFGGSSTIRGDVYEVVERAGISDRLSSLAAHPRDEIRDLGTSERLLDVKAEATRTWETMGNLAKPYSTTELVTLPIPCSPRIETMTANGCAPSLKTFVAFAAALRATPNELLGFGSAVADEQNAR